MAWREGMVWGVGALLDPAVVSIGNVGPSPGYPLVLSKGFLPTEASCKLLGEFQQGLLLMDHLRNFSMSPHILH